MENPFKAGDWVEPKYVGNILKNFDAKWPQRIHEVSADTVFYRRANGDLASCHFSHLRAVEDERLTPSPELPEPDEIVWRLEGDDATTYGTVAVVDFGNGDGKHLNLSGRQRMDAAQVDRLILALQAARERMKQ